MPCMLSYSFTSSQWQTPNNQFLVSTIPVPDPNFVAIACQFLVCFFMATWNVNQYSMDVCLSCYPNKMPSEGVALSPM